MKAWCRPGRTTLCGSSAISSPWRLTSLREPSGGGRHKSRLGQVPCQYIRIKGSKCGPGMSIINNRPRSRIGEVISSLSPDRPSHDQHKEWERAGLSGSSTHLAGHSPAPKPSLAPQCLCLAHRSTPPAPVAHPCSCSACLPFSGAEGEHACVQSPKV